MKIIIAIVGVVVGFLVGVVGCVALDSWFSPPGTVFGARDELGISHEILPLIVGIIAAIGGGIVSYSLWGKRA